VRSRPATRTALGMAVALTLAACGTGASAGSGGPGAASRAGPSSGSGGAGSTIRVIAAENFWGSIASQVGGSYVDVTSIIDNPGADPHDYEPTVSDARAVAAADLVLVNGIGYDTWAGKLIAANPSSSRTVLDVGDLLDAPAGGNPHVWYDPDDVYRVVDQLAADLAKAEPAAAGDFTAQRDRFLTVDLAQYKAAIDKIKTTYGGTPVGASESILAMLAPALGLDVLTPPSFLKATSEGTDPTAADKATIDQQIRDKKIKVYVYNSQNATPDVQAQVNEAKAAGIPVTTITETMTPANGTWQAWQTRQLVALRDALAQATGRR
jgi:zinc/manganese transport system substrate-binding protein